MSGKPEYSALSENDREAVDGRVAQYQQILSTAGASPAISLDYFVPSREDALRLATLERLASIDLEHHWSHGSTPSADDYLTRFPELVDTAAKVQIIRSEYLARVAAGNRVELSEFRRRYPDDFDRLSALIGDRAEGSNDPGNSAHGAPVANQEPTSHNEVQPDPRQTLQGDPRSTLPIDGGTTEAESQASTGGESDGTSVDAPATDPDPSSTVAVPSATPNIPPQDDDQSGGPAIADASQTLRPFDTASARADGPPELQTESSADSNHPAKGTIGPSDAQDPNQTMRPDQTMAVPGAAPREHEESARPSGNAKETLRSDDPAPDTSSFSGNATIGFDGSATLASGPHDGQSLPSKAAPSNRNKTLGDGRYTLNRMLGRGQYGAVWEAHAQGKVRVAVKLIQFPIGHKMTQQELRALDVIKELRHPLLVQVHAYWVEQDQLVIVMDLADKTLEGRLNECIEEGHGGIPPEELVTYISDAADAIDFLHNRNVIHRDIKPANLLLKGDRALVGDFGLARVLERHNETDAAKATVIGTPMYMAPEVFDGDSSHRTDQYSLAVAYVELRTGRTPFHGDSLAAVMKAQLTMRPDLKDLTDDERRVLERALSKKPENRYPTCREFASELERTFQPPIYPWLEQTLKWATAGSIVLMLGLLVWLSFFRFGVDVQPAVTASAGQTTSFRVPISQPLIRRDYELAFSPEIPGIEISSAPNSDGQSSQVEVRVDDSNHVAETYTVTIESSMSWRRKRNTFTLRVEPPQVEVPAGFTPSADAKIVDCLNGDKLFERIQRTVGTGDKQIIIDLVLVGFDQDAVKPFYVMTNKVHNALFAVFAKEKPEAVEDSTWREGGLALGEEVDRPLPAKEYPMHPVFGVSVPAALDFARWMGGTLPTVRQWQLAAHADRWDAASNVVQVVYPFESEWEPLPEPNESDAFAVAVQRVALGPLDIGQATDDVTRLGIHDLAGNGYEWTRDAYNDNRSNLVDVRRFIESKQEAWVITRGMSYMQDEPFRFRHDYLDEASPLIKDGGFYANEETSFRVIVEP